MHRLIEIIFISFLFYQGCAGEECRKNDKPVETSQVQKLKNALLCDYDKSVRPVLHHTRETPVHVTMILKSLSFEEGRNSLNIYAWMVWEWIDEHLIWNPADYEGLIKINLDSSEIWVPEVSQFISTAYWEGDVRIGNGRCIVRPSGRVMCIPTVTYYSLCVADIKLWPYDKHNCTLRLAAWMNTGQEIDLNGDEVDLSIYRPNRAWKLLAVESRLHRENYGNNVSFPWLNYSFILERHSSMSVAIVGIPALMFAALVLCSFWMDPTEPVRIFLGCLNIMSTCFYLQYLGWMVGPNAENCPLVILFYRDSLILSGMSLVATVIVRYIKTGTSSPPQWVPTVTNWVTSMRPGQLLLFGELSAKSAATLDEGSGEEGAGLVASSPQPSGGTWQFFAILIDRILFIVFVLTYLILLLICFT